MMHSTRSPFSLQCQRDRILEALLQMRSDGADVAGLARYLHAMFATYGYFALFSFHHLNGSLKVSSASCNGHAPCPKSMKYRVSHPSQTWWMVTSLSYVLCMYHGILIPCL